MTDDPEHVDAEFGDVPSDEMFEMLQFGEPPDLSQRIQELRRLVTHG